MGGSAMICRDCCVSASCRGELNTEETETDREEDNRGKEGRPDRMDGPRQSRRHRQAEGDVVPPLIEITHRYGKRTGGCGCGCSCSCNCNCGETGAASQGSVFCRTYCRNNIVATTTTTTCVTETGAG